MAAEPQTAYAAAGVDIEAGERAVELMKAAVATTHRPEVLGGLGGFAGFFDAAALAKFRHPVLATSTDGVGTKVAIARAMGVYDTIGFDLIGMLVDDLVVVGAEPLFVTDYIACGKLYPERIASVVAGISAACRVAGAALLGGETAEHPGLMAPDELDLAGATTGVVERDEILGPQRVEPGDILLGLASSGLHSNGYSLVRRVLLEDAGWTLERDVAELGRPLGEELLEPTRVYAAACLEVIRATAVHAMSHITGGGLANNLARVLPEGVHAVIDRASWQPGAIFSVVQQVGGIAQLDVEATLNQGVGMVLVLPPSSKAAAQEVLSRHGMASWQLGEINSGPVEGKVRMVGNHPA